jgi:hypothetical protein
MGRGLIDECRHESLVALHGAAAISMKLGFLSGTRASRADEGVRPTRGNMLPEVFFGLIATLVAV